MTTGHESSTHVPLLLLRTDSAPKSATQLHKRGPLGLRSAQISSKRKHFPIANFFYEQDQNKTMRNLIQNSQRNQITVLAKNISFCFVRGDPIECDVQRYNQKRPSYNVFRILSRLPHSHLVFVLCVLLTEGRKFSSSEQRYGWY